MHNLQHLIPHTLIYGTLTHFYYFDKETIYSKKPLK